MRSLGYPAYSGELDRKKGVVGKFVEFYGKGLSSLSVADRATISNMSPEYGSGSSRDWAAKGPRLLGVRAVIAESFERIRRTAGPDCGGKCDSPCGEKCGCGHAEGKCACGEKCAKHGAMHGKDDGDGHGKHRHGKHMAGGGHTERNMK
jgi:hypothetical protein